LPNLGVVAPYCLGKPGKGLWGGGGGLGARPEEVSRAGEPRRRNFVQVPPLLSAMSTDQVEVARFFREVYEWPP
jgi:hypothetical protein